jgi:gluconolactonase
MAACLSGVVLLASLNVVAQAEDKGKAKTVSIKVRDVTLTVPTTWKQQTPANKLRLAQFLIPAVKGDKDKTELVVSSFGGFGGGVDANLSRWVTQFRSIGRKVKLTQGKSTYGMYFVADISGTYNKPDGPPFARKTKPTPNSRMVAVILIVEKKAVYFLKMAGADKSVVSAARALRTSFGGDPAKEKEYEIGKGQ